MVMVYYSSYPSLPAPHSTQWIRLEPSGECLDSAEAFITVHGFRAPWRLQDRRRWEVRQEVGDLLLRLDLPQPAVMRQRQDSPIIGPPWLGGQLASNSALSRSKQAPIAAARPIASASLFPSSPGPGGSESADCRLRVPDLGSGSGCPLATTPVCALREAEAVPCRVNRYWKGPLRVRRQP